jgi:hypothetical protein
MRMIMAMVRVVIMAMVMTTAIIKRDRNEEE